MIADLAKRGSPMMERAASALVLLAALVLGCESSKTALSGAYGDVPYDRISAYRDHRDLVIIYEADGLEGGTNQVARLTLHTDRLEIEPDEELWFVAPEVSPPAGQIERYLTHRGQHGEAVQEPPLPEILRASVIFYQYGEELGSRLHGQFRCEFIDKKHLNGDFDAALGRP